MNEKNLSDAILSLLYQKDRGAQKVVWEAYNGLLFTAASLIFAKVGPETERLVIECFVQIANAAERFPSTDVLRNQLLKVFEKKCRDYLQSHPESIHPAFDPNGENSFDLVMIRAIFLKAFIDESVNH